MRKNDLEQLADRCETRALEIVTNYFADLDRKGSGPVPDDIKKANELLSSAAAIRRIVSSSPEKF